MRNKFLINEGCRPFEPQAGRMLTPHALTDVAIESWPIGPKISARHTWNWMIIFSIRISGPQQSTGNLDADSG